VRRLNRGEWLGSHALVRMRISEKARPRFFMRPNANRMAIYLRVGAAVHDVFGKIEVVK
jgi:hypothetical protein